MNNRGDNSPSLDYEELRRRHEQFKRRQALNEKPAAPASPRPARPMKPAPSPEPEPVREESVQKPAEETTVPAEPARQPAPETPVDAPAPEDLPETDPQPEAPLSDGDYDEDYADEDYDGEDYDEEDDEDLADDSPNPFGSFIQMFRGLQGRLHNRRAKRETDEEEPDDLEDGEDFPEDEDEEFEAPKKRRGLFGRRKKREDEYVDYDDSDYADEGYEEEQFPERPAPAEPAAEEKPQPESQPEPQPEPAAPPVKAAASEDVEDTFEDAPAPSRPAARRVSLDNLDDEDYGGESFDDDDEDDGETRESGLKRFMRLFVVRDDEEDAQDDEDFDAEDDDWSDESGDGEEDFSERFLRRRNASVDGEQQDDYPERISLKKEEPDSEGGLEMDEKNKVSIEMTKQMGEGLESGGMSRRERRERAERLAAQQAAKRAAAPIPEIETPLVADSVNDVSSGIVEIQQPTISLGDLDSAAKPAAVEPAVKEVPAEPEADDVDEPTREFKPLSRRAAKSKSDLFSFDASDDEEDDEDEDEDEEPAEKHGRFSLFGKKSARDEEEDEDDEEDDEDDEDEEPAPRKSRRDHSARKSRASRYDEDDEDEDGYDEYDDYDEDDDDYDDDDDEEGGFGRALIGFFKGLFGVILFLLVVVFALNALDFFNVMPLDSVYEKYYNKAPGVFDTLFPSHTLKKPAEQGGDITAVDPLEQDAQQTLAPEATEAPVVTAEPVVTEAPAETEAPQVTPETVG